MSEVIIRKHLAKQLCFLMQLKTDNVSETDLPRLYVSTYVSGAPNENIVQNHSNIALLNVF